MVLLNDSCSQQCDHTGKFFLRFFAKYSAVIFSINIQQKYSTEIFLMTVMFPIHVSFYMNCAMLFLYAYTTNFVGEYFTCRFTCSENREAYRKLIAGYDANIMGMVMEGILLIHKDKKITYTLSEDADKLYEKIIDKLNDQFNFKYTSASQLSSSQPDLNNNEKSELSV